MMKEAVKKEKNTLRGMSWFVALVPGTIKSLGVFNT